MIDSHCHINFIDNGDNPQAIVDDTVRSGVGKIINIGTDLPTSFDSVNLAEKFEEVYAAVGVHPHDAKTVDEQTIEKLRELAKKKKVVAIGEIGLDYYRDLSPRKVQKEVFEKQLELAIELNLPVVIHTREAFQDTVAVVKNYASRLKGGVFHCFPGTIDDADTVFEMGLLISVGGIITFKNSKMAKVAREVPLEKVILETDAPYLTPVPFRGKPNRPALVKYVYMKLAELKNMPFDEVEKTVDRTCGKLFSLVETFGD
ncbi:MAG: TatD family hydrolase [FCB group bacterium]|nr:TatD family hydrolase [FCB group bacterium]